MKEKFYCKEYDQIGYTCEEQCDKCKKAEQMPQSTEGEDAPSEQDELWGWAIERIVKWYIEEEDDRSKEKFINQLKKRLTITRKP